MRISWTETQFLYCYECIYPTYTARVRESNGVWMCEECGATNDINKEEKLKDKCVTCNQEKDSFSKEWEYSQCQSCSMKEETNA